MRRSGSLRSNVLWLSCWALTLLHAVGLLALASVEYGSAGTPPDSKDSWTEDHSFVYERRFAKLADGATVVATNATSTLTSLQKWRQTVPIARWYLSSNGSRSVKTVRRIIKDVEAAKYPDAKIMRGGRLVTQHNLKNVGRGSAVKSELFRGVAKQAQMLLGSVKRMYSNYIEGELLEAMRPKYSAAQLQKIFIEQHNTTLSESTIEDYDELQRDKYVKPYEWDGDQRRLPILKTFSERFQPFPGYGNKYYTHDDSFSEATVPAASYPWKWRAHLAVVRGIALDIITTRVVVASEKREETNDGEGEKYELPTTLLPQTDEEETYLEHLERLGEDDEYLWRYTNYKPEDSDGDAGLPGLGSRRLLQVMNASDRTGMNFTMDPEVYDPNEEFIDEQVLDTMERVALLLSQFHFNSGIPRFTMRKNSSRYRFPSFAAYQRNVSRYLESVQLDQSEELQSSTEELVQRPQYRHEDSEQLLRRRLIEASASIVNSTQDNASEYSFEGDGTIYTALLDFYAYPAVDKELLIVSDNDKAPETGLSPHRTVSECKLLHPCYMQSGITVYTPLLTNLSAFSEFANPNSPAALASPTAMRMQGLRGMVETAFVMEREALRHGLQAPSTVWYSLYDQNSDEFADAIVGSANMTNATEILSSSATFERLVDPKKSLINLLPSYYSRTVASSVHMMDRIKSVPKPTNFSEPELVELLDFIIAQFKALDEAVVAYKHTRDRDPQRQILANMTQRREFYYGSEYTLLGFGFVMPETNVKNAVLRDMRLPVAFHLLVRIFTRFHESCIMLPEESRFLFACLALWLNDTPFYRCRRRTAPPAPIVD